MGALLIGFYSDRPYFERSSISPVFIHVTNLIGSGIN